MDVVGKRIAAAYSAGHISGWLGANNPELARRELESAISRGVIQPEFNLLGGGLIRRTSGRRAMLYEVCRKVLGKDTPNYAQQVGDPFAAGTMVLMADGTEKAIETLNVGDVVLNHRLEQAHVNRVIEKKFSGRMITVWLEGWPRSLTATETHHGMTMSRDHSTLQRTKFGNVRLGDFMLTPGREQCPRQIKMIDETSVTDHTVYCITTENEFTAVFNGIASFQCVSFGAKNATEYLTCTEILGVATRQTQMSPADYLAAWRLKWRPVFPPYYYGTGRIYVGGGQIPANEDGSMGSWMAEAVMKYGTLFADEEGVPEYAAQVAKKWGASKSELDKWQPTAKNYLVKSTALIKTWDDLCDALCHGYPVTTASEVGYSMLPNDEGFHEQTDNWGHQMAFIGIDETSSKGPFAIILNNWGAVHGQLKDFDTGDPLPEGVLRVRQADAMKHIHAGETFAYSNFAGFPAQDIEKALFMLL